MKKYVLLTIVLLSCIFLAACGEKEEPGAAWQGISPGTEDLTVITDRTEYYDVAVETEELFDLGLWGKNTGEENYFSTMVKGKAIYYHEGTQFYQGEPVQFWVEQTLKASKLYMYKRDNSKELMLDGVSSEYTNSVTKYKWYMDQEGDFYCYGTKYSQVNGEMKEEGRLVKILSSGEILYESAMGQDTGIVDMCQLENGRVYLLWEDVASGNQAIAEIEPDTGELIAESRIDLPFEPNYVAFLGTAGDALAVIGQNLEIGQQVARVDPADKSMSPIMYFAGTSYGWGDGSMLQDMRVMEDGSLELIWSDYTGENCRLDKVRMEKVTKTPIVLRGILYNNSWLADRAAQFNRENDDYHIVIEDCGIGNDEEDFARLTSVQVGAGKGPDILCGSMLLEDYIEGMLEKGALEELNPYMEASGIREEDYFPLAFSTWRQGGKIYGVNFDLYASGSQMDERVLGSRETPDIETQLEALLQWEGNEVYCQGYDSAGVLNLLLRGTESFYGMVDWEKGTCDFSSPLFGKLLEVAGRYGDDGRKKEAVSIRKELRLANLIAFDGKAEREAEGWVVSGVLFDDGCHAVSSSWSTMTINANSAHKEAAWEFIAFLLSEEVQSKGFDWNQSPVHREAFRRHTQEKVINTMVREHYVNGVMTYPAYYGEDVSEEKQAEYLQALEEARPLPLGTAPILEIILEEARDYFNGSKGTEEVGRVVGNRVQLYLNERK